MSLYIESGAERDRTAFTLKAPASSRHPCPVLGRIEEDFSVKASPGASLIFLTSFPFRSEASACFFGATTSPSCRCGTYTRLSRKVTWLILLSFAEAGSLIGSPHRRPPADGKDRKSTRLNSRHSQISY